MFELRVCGSESDAAGMVAVAAYPRLEHLFAMTVDHTVFYFEDDPRFTEPLEHVIPFMCYERGGFAWSDSPTQS